MAKLMLAVLALVAAVSVSAAGMLLGGPVDVDVNSPGVKDVLSVAMYKYNKVSNDKYASRAVEVVRAQRKLVNGYLYYLDVQVSRTKCKNPTTNPNDCELHTEGNLAQKKLCQFQVISRPWKSLTEMTDFHCT